ncbi:integral membrane protein [Paecilomyces variotii No. 5]|uniref:Integral membrane protein n=1 Tax=Byssochlamys spectabilis (strain No. 5 / NBRC 109023) TaxID=1356009 RepID=V5GBQ4_BYSSN|nr:integral membrane protein [Paecilomyces variotii No. 5]
MDRFDSSKAPPEYRKVEWLSNLFIAGMGIGWVINYVGMIYQSFRDKTYSMAILPLCCNIAWEFVFGLIYPSENSVEHCTFLAGLTVNFAIIYAAVRFAPNEWPHSPLVMKNMALIFFFGISACVAGHLALAAEIGSELAISWVHVVHHIHFGSLDF